ncbi:hypothetical protein [Actinocrispum wychmicini]|uniref:CDP-glycerol:poly(Glycerophosphate) glycerophosphotransferase n=1 Tax=Actinocrispum wychmicini TaxID=1213861 RepID=A0A4V2S693_9PSEU|nr:hypothetical protein [Actinocrispum wychmicini]TCO55160.1 hypothetical protein EV192_108448 [Actinocrispum wychmicini]
MPKGQAAVNAWHSDQSPPRETWSASRRALVVVRNLTSWDRLTDLLPLFAGDRAVRVEYTVDRGSSFSAGIERYLESLGVEITPWERVVDERTEYPLILAAHANSHLGLLNGQVFVVPHGVGHGRKVVEKTGHPEAPSGASERELTYRGVVIPTVIGVSHRDQIDQIKSWCPAAADRAQVIGDPTYDRMAASVVNRRDYRRALGVGDDRQLVVVSSTWGQHSLMGQTEDFVQRLVAQLPVDEFQVALVLHPNIWTGHITYNVKEIFREARAGGLLLIPPDKGWRAALIAADLVLGDHGSTTFYGAVLRRPAAQVVDGLAELDPDSALAMFCHSTVRLDRWGGLHDQVAALIRDHRPMMAERVTRAGVAARTRSLEIIHDIIYDLLDLDPPEPTPWMWPVDPPQPYPRGTTTSFLTSAFVDVRNKRVFLARLPGMLAERHRSPSDTTDWFRVVEAREVHRPACENADVYVNLEPLSDGDAYAWTRNMARTYGGAKVVASATNTGCVIWLHDTYFKMSGVDTFAAAAAVYGWVVTGQRLPGGLTVSMGCLHQMLRLRKTVG